MTRLRLVLAAMSILGSCVSDLSQADWALASTHPHLIVANDALALSAKLDARMKRFVKSQSFSGTALVTRGGKVLLDKGYGLADRVHHLRNKPTTEFRVFDLTQQFTAMAILQLQERGKLDVQDPICSYLADCPSAWQPITLHQLLAHTSGIPDFTKASGFNVGRPFTPEQTTGLVKNKPLDFPPGSQFGYSQTNYVLLGLVIEKTAGESYGTFLGDNIFRPLDMTHTGLLHDGLTVPHVAIGYRGSHRARRVDATTPWAASGLYSTTEDLRIWDQALATQNLVSTASLNAMFTPYIYLTFGLGSGYGWLIGEEYHRKAILHGGGSYGYQAFNILFPRDHVSIVVLSNQEDADPVDVAIELASLLFQKSAR